MLVQAIGLAAAALFIFSFQLRSRKVILILQFLADVLFCIQFYFLGGISGCYGMILNIVRNFMLIFYDRSPLIRWKGWIGVFCVIALFLTVISWEGPVSLLPLFANIACFVGYWTGSTRNIRLCNLFCACPCWLTYDLVTGSLGGALNETVSIISILISLFRFGWKGKD